MDNSDNIIYRRPTLTLVATDTSRIIFSNAAVSSACFWLCSAIFSLNFLGFAIFMQLCTYTTATVRPNTFPSYRRPGQTNVRLSRRFFTHSPEGSATVETLGTRFNKRTHLIYTAHCAIERFAHHLCLVPNAYRRKQLISLVNRKIKNTN